MQLPTLDYMISIARERATITGEAHAVCVIDCLDSVRRIVIPLEDTDEPDFAEFSGRIECVVQP